MHDVIFSFSKQTHVDNDVNGKAQHITKQEHIPGVFLFTRQGVLPNLLLWNLDNLRIHFRVCDRLKDILGEKEARS